VSITCEKCSERASTVLCIEEPDWPYDPVAGWFKCDECHAEDPEGWSYVLDAEQFGDISKPLPKDPPGGRPRTGRPKPQIDEAVINRAIGLYGKTGSVKKVAEQMIDELPWGTVGSATESLRRIIRERAAVAS
jgi:hypothetical protein